MSENESKIEIENILTNAYPRQHSPKAKSVLQQPAVFCQFVWYTKAAKVAHAVTLIPLATCTSMPRPWLIPMPLNGRLYVRQKSVEWHTFERMGTKT